MKKEDTHFQICKTTNQHQLKITLEQNGLQQVIKFSIHSKQNFDVYELTIDEIYLKRPQMKELTFLFPTCHQIFDQLKEIVNEIVITDNGNIKFDVVFGRNGVKQIRLPLIKKSIEKTQFLLLRINQMQQHCKRQIASIRSDYNKYLYDMKKQHHQQITFLSNQLQKSNLQINHLKLVLGYQGELIKEVNEVTASGGKLQRKKSEQQIKQRLIQKIKRKTTKLKSRAKNKMNIMSQDESHTQIEIKQHPYPSEKAEICKQIISPTQNHTSKILQVRMQQLYPLQRNPHNCHFATEISNKSLLIRKINNDGFYSYIPKLKIPPKRVTRLRIKQQHTKEQYIMVGIGTTAIIGLIDAYYMNTCMAYFSESGWIYKDGGNEGTGIHAVDGSIIDVQVDTINNTIQWNISSHKNYRLNMSNAITNRQIHFVIMMAHSNDTVRLMIQ